MWLRRPLISASGISLALATFAFAGSLPGRRELARPAPATARPAPMQPVAARPVPAPARPAPAAEPYRSAPAPAGEPVGQVVGAYAQGSLVDASSLAPHGDGFLHLFERRDRHYGSQGLVDILTQVSAEMSRRHPRAERLQVGDIAARHGGPISGHASHQNGLDADIVYYRRDHREQTADDGDQGFVETFVKNGKITANLDVARNWEFIKLVAATGRLARAFVHPAIKKAYCAEARKRGELQSQADTLSKIRLLDNHDDHIHLRLTCPETSPACIKQDPPPADTGC